MKKTILIILITLFVNKIEAQHSQPSYVFTNLNVTGATNVMSSTAFSHPLEGYTMMFNSGLEYCLFINESVALRGRCAIGYGPTNTEFNNAIITGGLGFLVSTLDGKPYGFVELRPRLNASATTIVASTQQSSTFFVAAIVGVGWNRPITNTLWLMGEIGFLQNFTIHTTGDNIRDESACFLSIGVRYLMNYEGE